MNVETTELGWYRDTATGKRFFVLKETKLISSQTLVDPGRVAKGSSRAYTECGLTLNPGEKDGSTFHTLDGATLVREE